MLLAVSVTLVKQTRTNLIYVCFIPIGALQPIPRDPKKQWHGSHVGGTNKRC